jgi:predicted DNA binding protein
MREFAFTIAYDEGADRLVDLLSSAPAARSNALVCAQADAELWRLDRVTGPSAVVDEAVSLLTDGAYDGLSVSDRPCDGERYTDVLERTARNALVYTYVDTGGRCDAVSLIADRYLSGGALFEVTRRENTERWRILMQDDEKVSMIYDTIGATLRDGLSFRFEHLEDVTEPPLNPFGSRSLRPERRRVLELAAESGYYETPRETTLDDLAAELDWPRSTVSYRLRRAEAALVEWFLSSA